MRRQVLVMEFNFEQCSVTEQQAIQNDANKKNSNQKQRAFQ